jgi:hypothetical protein
MPIRVRLSAIVEAMEMQSDEMTSYLHRPTGRVLTVSDEAFRAAEDDDEEWVEPEELADARSVLAAEDEYLALPDRFEIDEYRMMERFATGLDDAAARDAAQAALRGRGAFRFFKDTVHRLGLAPAWYAHRDNAYLDVARAWCEANGIEHDLQQSDA